MNMTGLVALAALACEGASEVLHAIAMGLGGHGLVRQAERGILPPGLVAGAPSPLPPLQSAAVAEPA